MSSCPNGAFRREPDLLSASRVASSRSLLRAASLVPFFVSKMCRNNTAIDWLGLISATGRISVPNETGAVPSPEQKDPANGTLYQRHQDHGRPVLASIAGHLLCR